MRVLNLYAGVGGNRLHWTGADVTAVELDPAIAEIYSHHFPKDEMIIGDAHEYLRDYVDDGWDLMIAHPPCTYFANSGVCWLHTEEGRWEKLDEAAVFFNTLLDSSILLICVENPIPHKYAIERIGGRKYTQLIQPYMFGHKETKATCLWLKGLDPLIPTSDLKKETMALPSAQRQRIHWLPPSPDRWKLRSTTYQGIADAMANQWGDEL